MKIIKKVTVKKVYPSLYDAFDLGDRVKRLYKDLYGQNKEYKGIVLAIDNKGMEIYWDTENGEYKPGEMNIDFTYCEADEIFKGSNKYTPIKKDDQ